MRSVDCVVVGGGVAGLAAANALSDMNHEVVLIEAGSYPRQQVCGEFLSGAALAILDEWKISQPHMVEKAIFHIGKREIEIPLEAGALSRSVLDTQLADRAKSNGVKVWTGEKVTAIEPGDHFWITLKSGERLAAEQLIVSTGKLSKGSRAPAYTGFKAHCNLTRPLDHLEMRVVKGGYVGVAPLGDGVVNIAGLVRGNADPDKVAEVVPGLDGCTFDWMVARVPEFGMRKWDRTERLYPVGDAAGTVYPVTGSGLAMALTSGVMAAQHVANGDWRGYRKDWIQRYGPTLRWGRWLHRALMHPTWIARLAAVPGLAEAIYRRTRIR